MSQNTLLLTFFLMFILSLSFFFQRDYSTNLSQQEQNSYLTLYQFKYSKYTDTLMTKSLEGNKASLVSVNELVLSDHIKGWRYLSGTQLKKEELETSQINAQLNTRTLDDFQGIVSVKDAYFKKGVTMKREELVIYTEEAHYLKGVKNQLVGDKPVHATLKNQFIDAAHGFELDLDKEFVEFFGPVQGVVFPNEKT